MYNQPKRVEFLDSIRGLAALFVLVGHTIRAFAWPAAFESIVHWPFVSILFDGTAAVAMFFVLSGYVLSKPYVDIEAAPARRIFLPTFYLRRFIRIWPPWFFAFIISIFAKKFLFFQPATQPPVSSWLDGFWHTKLTMPDFFRQCFFALNNPSRQLLNQDWSLRIELKGSILIPLFVIFARRKHVLLVFLLAVVFLIFVGTGQYYVSFIIGVLVAQYDTAWTVHLDHSSRSSRWLIFIGGLLLYQGLNLLYRLLPGSHLTYKYGWIITALGCALILISIFNSQSLQQILNCRPIVFLGRISYSVYLLQFIIIICLLPPLMAVFNKIGVTQYWFLFPMTFFVCVTVTIGLAAIMYRFVELPVINFSHWVTKKIQQYFQT